MMEHDNPFGELMRRAQDGDQAAYAELLTSVTRPMRSYLFKHFPGIRDPEDVVQESLITLHKIRHTYDPTRPFIPWVMAIVRHRSLDYLRKFARIQSREVQEDIIVEMAAAPDKTNENEGVEAALARLEVLPEKERSIIQALKIDGQSVKDVAAQFGLSESNVKVIASRGYEKLRRTWKER